MYMKQRIHQIVEFLQHVTQAGIFYSFQSISFDGFNADFDPLNYVPIHP